ncbi:hypothetical protein GKZ90_0010305 [Flavobacterium sp. MC2016-06]|jgi:hypothetical protein|uniref:hypothetical protein n=1 Tax=Flavobacterium sp. MC2016-06 TaxID=2676308 RepID=UPI0012BAD750|nr:hypothetical protein [Flavobacterium sp. MC2016-06]MBU3858491.1 hypothetical protein [Flavobacterium sp. MC2016-06]
MNETFKIKETGFEEIKKQLLIKSVPLMIISLTFGAGIVYFNTKDKEDFFAVLPFIIPIFLLSLGYGIFTGLKRQKMLFKSYKLTFLENSVSREQINTPTVTIQFDDIKAIIKNENGSYAIKGKTTVDTILIPAQIDHQENLETLFNQIKPIQEINKPAFDEKYKIPLLLLMMCCMAVVYVSFNKILVLISGLIVSILLIRSSFQIIRNKSIDKKTKRVGYYSLLVLASVVAVTIMKITVF